jgi:hypothetical protein
MYQQLAVTKNQDKSKIESKRALKVHFSKLVVRRQRLVNDHLFLKVTKAGTRAGIFELDLTIKICSFAKNIIG